MEIKNKGVQSNFEQRVGYQIDMEASNLWKSFQVSR